MSILTKSKNTNKVFWDKENSIIRLWVAHEHAWTTPRGEEKVTTHYLSNLDYNPTTMGDRSSYELNNGCELLRRKAEGTNRHNHIRTVCGYLNGRSGDNAVRLFKIVRLVGDNFSFETWPEMGDDERKMCYDLFLKVKETLLTKQPKN